MSPDRWPALVRAVAVACLAVSMAASGATKQDSARARAAAASTKKARKAVDPAPPVDVGDPREAQARQTVERDRLTTRIAALKAQIAAGERSRSGTSAALRRAERALDDVNRRIADLARRQRDSQERIAGLDRQRTGTEGQLAAREADFGRTATLWLASRDEDPRQAWLAGGDPAEPTFAELHLQAAAQSEAAGIDALHGRVRDLQTQRQRADDDHRALLAQAEAQQAARDALAADRAARQKSLAEISRQIDEQKTAAAALAADEQRLSRVVERLQRVIEQQAAEARRREDAKRQADAAARRNRNAPPKSRDVPPPATVDTVPDGSGGNGAFAQLRGQLRLPVRGAVVGRFGAPRGSSGATWKGVFVRTEAGADVHAVASGKVVFADDLRGFGNLVIIDHGDQYLSIYGNNQALLRHAGDTVKSGDVIARTGNSSGDEDTGLYFELRYRQRPFDPLGWTGAR